MDSRGDNLTISKGDKSHFLVINADDYGYSEERDKGILECFEKSAISSASLLVNGLNSKQAADWAENVKLPLGLHLNLTEGLPVSTTCESLLGSGGYFLGKFGFRDKLSLGKIDFNEVEGEIIDQINLFQELTGYFPYHVDGHQHIHVLPGIRDVFSKVMEDRGIKVTRLPVEICVEQCDWLKPELLTFYKEVITQAMVSKEIFQKHDLRFTDAFVGLSTCGVNMTMEKLKRALDTAFGLKCVPTIGSNNHSVVKVTEKTNQLSGLSNHSITMATKKPKLPVRTCELMVHPGYCTGNYGGCGSGPDDFAQSKDREHEMKVLTCDEFKNHLSTSDITICNFKEIL